MSENPFEPPEIKADEGDAKQSSPWRVFLQRFIFLACLTACVNLLAYAFVFAIDASSFPYGGPKLPDGIRRLDSLCWQVLYPYEFFKIDYEQLWYGAPGIVLVESALLMLLHKCWRAIHCLTRRQLVAT